jgi:hypothetical protein
MGLQAAVEEPVQLLWMHRRDALDLGQAHVRLPHKHRHRLLLAPQRRRPLGVQRSGIDCGPAAQIGQRFGEG